MTKLRHLSDIARAFLKLGSVSFGGPVAHLGYFREEFVVKRRWLDDEAYADLVALCQFLPGPASSQVVFALGMGRAGLAGALTASACFTLPSALLMIAFAYGVMSASHLHQAGWLHGLKLAAVAVVAQAVWGMGKKLCPDPARIALVLAAAAAVIVMPGVPAQAGILAAGAAAGWLLYRTKIPAHCGDGASLGGRHAWAAGALALFAGLLIALPVLADFSGRKDIQVFDDFYRAGALVFGGGHVVLPLLHAGVVPPGWVGNDAFLAGYGAAQAVPGPLFTFAAYLGTLIDGGPHAWLGGLGCLFAIFLPAWLLIGGALPFWSLLRGKPWAQSALRGANAAVVGLLLAALYNPLWRDGVTSAWDVVAVLLAFLCLQWWRTPPWLVVVLAAVAGRWLL